MNTTTTTTTALSFAKPFTTTSSQIPTTTQYHRHLRPLTLARIKCKSSSSSDSNITTSNGIGNTSPPVPPPTPPPEQVLFRRGRRRSRKEKEDAVATGQPKKVEKKDWDSMTMSEKAIELYVGEKGILFWLNKLAYASIYVMIGGWILFRFVGPALNLYQLDSAPLPPTALLKGSWLRYWYY